MKRYFIILFILLSSLSGDTNRPTDQSNPVEKNAVDTWGKHINPKGIIPKNRFKAFYFNTKDPRNIIATEEVSKVGINYPFDQFHKIPSEDFGGYWVGDFQYDEEKSMELSLELSWAKARVIINGVVVYEGENSTTFPYIFKKGSNVIEVEYVNNWHTTGFKMSVQPMKKKYNTGELQTFLSEQVSKEAEVLYAGAYESAQTDQSVFLKLGMVSKPVILVLNSYSGINWKISNPNHVKIEAIVYSAYQPGTEIMGDISKTTPKLAYDGTIGSYTMEQQCDCHGAIFHCEGSNGLSVIRQIESLTKRKVLGYDVYYAPKVMLLPKVYVTPERLRAFEYQKIKIEQQEKACNKEINPDFNTLFKN